MTLLDHLILPLGHLGRFSSVQGDTPSDALGDTLPAVLLCTPNILQYKTIYANPYTGIRTCDRNYF